MYRLVALATTFVLALLAVPGTALASHGEDNGNCPDYTHSAWAAGSGAQFNEQGQLLLTVHDGSETYYVAHDYTFGVTGTEYLFSIWFFQETNGHPGLQRDDDYCRNTAPDEDADGYCFC